MNNHLLLGMTGNDGVSTYVLEISNDRVSTYVLEISNDGVSTYVLEIGNGKSHHH
jgi:hypothetical protein